MIYKKKIQDYIESPNQPTKRRVLNLKAMKRLEIEVQANNKNLKRKGMQIKGPRK